jgi:hypothetical protein
MLNAAQRRHSPEKIHAPRMPIVQGMGKRAIAEPSFELFVGGNGISQR